MLSLRGSLKRVPRQVAIVDADGSTNADVRALIPECRSRSRDISGVSILLPVDGPSVEIFSSSSRRENVTKRLIDCVARGFFYGAVSIVSAF
jgi:hypothetical protein